MSHQDAINTILCEDPGRTPEQVAELLKVTPSYISMLLGGRRKVNFSLVGRAYAFIGPDTADRLLDAMKPTGDGNDRPQS